MYDAIIVGARVAGAPTAMLLARKGYRVLLVDRDTFPSDIMSTHYIHQFGLAKLAEWGLLEQVEATNCPRIWQLTNDFGGLVLSGLGPPVNGIGYALCPRRKGLDAILVQAAVDAGVEVREGFTVQEVLSEGGRVTGIRGHARGGTDLSEQARIVVGADGVRSLVARAVDAPEYNARPAMSCGYYTYYSGVQQDGASLFNRGDKLLFEFPTNDGLTCVAMETPNSAFKEFRTDIEGNFNRNLQAVPALAERVAAGTREERFVGLSDVPNFYRKPYGPGWALVGDAGYHKDPVTGLGISDAFTSAAWLVDALDAGFSGRAPLEDALAGYEQQRNQSTMPLYELTLQQVSWQPPPPEMMLFIQAVAASPQATTEFFGLVGGGTRMDEFMAPENIGRLIMQAQAGSAAG